MKKIKLFVTVIVLILMHSLMHGENEKASEVLKRLNDGLQNARKYSEEKVILEGIDKVLKQMSDPEEELWKNYAIKMTIKTRKDIERTIGSMLKDIEERNWLMLARVKKARINKKHEVINQST